ISDTSRRNFLRGGALGTAGLVLSTPAATQGQEHELRHGSNQDPGHEHKNHAAPIGSPTDRGKLVAGHRDAQLEPVGVETPDIAKLTWEMKDGVKEFHLYCRHTRREFLPTKFFDVWGYNDSMPGPTIEAVEGDRVRFVVHNELPESTTVHWHGLE